MELVIPQMIYINQNKSSPQPTLKLRLASRPALQLEMEASPQPHPQLSLFFIMNNKYQSPLSCRRGGIEKS